MSGEGAEKLGERMLEEVMVEDMSEVFKSLRHMQLEKNASENDQASLPNPILDALGLGTHDSNLTSPILELISPPPAYHPSGAGKTSLLYLIISYAILPPYLSSDIPLYGQDAAAFFFDPLNHFSVPRLVQVMANLIRSKLQATGQKIDEAIMSEMRTVIERSVLHVHICRPKSWASLLAMVRSLPDYLFNKEKHESMHRRIHSIILDDIDAFTWSIRSSANSLPNNTNPISTASRHLTTSLQKLSARLSCAVILTSSSASPTIFRPSLPTSWSQNVQTTRVAVRRVEIVKFAPAISVEQAEAERQQRWKVVSKGRFECWNVGAGVKDGKGFIFRVGEWGVDVDVDRDSHEEPLAT